MAIYIDGKSLTIEEVIRVCREDEEVYLTEESKTAVTKARNYIEKKLEEGNIIYGLTTGFGKLANVFITKEESIELQKNLIISHTCTAGEPYPRAYVRAAMLLRCNALSRGNSGIRLSTLQTLIDMLNNKIHPVIPCKGSLGASGDLAPLSHIALGLIGLGEVEFNGEIVDAKDAMAKCGITPVELAAKEGLALNNGTQMMTAVGVNVVYDAMKLMKMADIAAALTAEALNGITKAYDPKTHLLRGHKGAIVTAENMRNLLDGSANAKREQETKVQDPYSLRCIPQVHGASKDALEHAYTVLSREINAVTDNPIIFPDEDDVISGGNFHGQPIALIMDYAKTAIAEIANISERRTERLTNPALSEGLPAFLSRNAGVNSGYMIAQYAAASMVSESKVYSHPACVDSIPSSGNQEDHVSMGTTSARTAAMVLENSQNVIGIEIAAATQGIWLRELEKGGVIDGLGKGTKAAYEYVRTVADPVDDDVIMSPYLKKFYGIVKDASVLDAVEKIVKLN